MRSVLNAFSRGTIVRGRVCTIRLYADGVAFPEEGQFPEATEVRGRLQEEIQLAVADWLGEEFEVRSVDWLPGSVEVLISIWTAYYAISNYDSFIKSLDLLTAQLKRTFARWVRTVWGGTSPVSATWLPSPSVARLEELPSLPRESGAHRFLLGYLVVSHAALLAVLVWLLVAHFK